MVDNRKIILAIGLVLIGVGLREDFVAQPAENAPEGAKVPLDDWQFPDATKQLSFQEEEPIRFIVGNPLVEEWNRLPTFWNEDREEAVDPLTGKTVVRNVVKIKVPLGLAIAPPVPAENPMTVARWHLGKELFFDPVLSADNTVSCATCHDPKTGFTTPDTVAKGIRGRMGRFNAPTIANAAYNPFQFWDGRAQSLEEQAQGPVQDPNEMADGAPDPWARAVVRVRRQGTYRQRFQKAFGTEPTRDTIAKALACYERTILTANSLHDRAIAVAQRRGGQREAAEKNLHLRPTIADYRAVLRDALERRDEPALEALTGFKALRVGLNNAEINLWATQIANGRNLFFGRARCSECHLGDRFTDDAFHNQGLNVRDGRPPPGEEGRFAALPVGRKDPSLLGAFKTPSLRGLVKTAPYMHDGSQSTLEDVIGFYRSNVQANWSLDIRRRDLETEREVHEHLDQLTPEKRPAHLFFEPGHKLVVPLQLLLSLRDEQELLAFLNALQGDPVDAVVAERP